MLITCGIVPVRLQLLEQVVGPSLVGEVADVLMTSSWLILIDVCARSGMCCSCKRFSWCQTSRNSTCVALSPRPAVCQGLADSQILAVSMPRSSVEILHKDNRQVARFDCFVSLPICKEPNVVSPGTLSLLSLEARPALFSKLGHVSTFQCRGGIFRAHEGAEKC